MTTINIKMDELKLSHELNISLTGILSSMELLRMSENLSSEQKELIELASQAGNRLSSLGKDLVKGIIKENDLVPPKNLLTRFLA